MILLFFWTKKKKIALPQEQQQQPPQPQQQQQQQQLDSAKFNLSPADATVIQDLNDPDSAKQKHAETELKNIFADKSGARSDDQKNDVRSALIHVGMHKIWADELLAPFSKPSAKPSAYTFSRDQALQCLNDRWKDRLIHLCNLITQQTNRLVQATTRQERENNHATTSTTFDALLQLARHEFWNGIEGTDPNASAHLNLLYSRLLVLQTLSYQAHLHYTLQRKAEQEGIFVILFEILDKNNERRLPFDSAFGASALVSSVVWQCFEQLILSNFRLQKWFEEECRKNARVLPKQRSEFRLFTPTPNFQHIEDLTKFYDDLCGVQPAPAQPLANDQFATVSLRGNRQISGTCYAYASARSFIHW